MSEQSPQELYDAQVSFAGARLEVIPMYKKVVRGFVNKVPVLLQFVTGTVANKERSAFELAIVLDISGSMAGAPLNSCKAALRQLINSASDDDKLTLITYDDRAYTVFGNVRCGNEGARTTMLQKVDAISTGGSTNLYAGLSAGYEALVEGDAEASTADQSAHKHIFLFSDGQVNCGVQDTEEILRRVAEWTVKVPIVSYGIGSGFNEKLMSPLGQVHRGSAYFYITDAASIERLVSRGVRALTSAVARDVRVQFFAQSDGVWLPDSVIDGARVLLLRERSVVQILIEVEVRPTARATAEAFSYKVENHAHLESASGLVSFEATDQRERVPDPQVLTFVDLKRANELRATASAASDPRAQVQRALKIFESRLPHDRFAFALAYANRTRALLDDKSAWQGSFATSAGTKFLGVKATGAAAAAAEDDDEESDEDMGFDLFD